MESLLTWGLGICVTGFFVLLAIIGRLNDKIESLKVDMEKRVPYEWLENKLNKEFGALNRSIEMMNEALVGTLEKRGILTAFHEHEKRIEDLEKLVNK